MTEPLEGVAEYSVYQFFIDGGQERVLEFVHAITAVKCVKQLTNSIGGRIGTTQRVIITDGGDCVVLEWKHGEGVVFPPEQTEDEQ